MKAVGKTHVGLVRANNQDAFLIEKGLFIVADGMGGHNGGEIASNEAVALLKEALAGKEPNIQVLEEAIIQVNHLLFLKQKEDDTLAGMGTTLTVLWEKPEEMLLGHVGDSRTYLLRKNQFTQVTQDHSIVAEMMRQGLLSKEQAQKHPYRNVVTRAVGSAETIEVDTLILDRKEKDKWLICSDGLTSMLEDKQINQILEKETIEKAVETLMQAALKEGGRDNISIVLLEDEGALG